MEDEILLGSCVAHQGKVVNPRVASALEAAAGSKQVS
jgi:hypothetical protein